MGRPKRQSRNTKAKSGMPKANLRKNPEARLLDMTNLLPLTARLTPCKMLLRKLDHSSKLPTETEEIAALNLAKFRKVAAECDSASGRADVAEQALAKSRARGRSCSIGPQ